MKRLSEKEFEDLVEIAKKHIYSVETRGDLETHNNDSEDFLNVSVWNIKAVLEEAYKLGKDNGARKAKGAKIKLVNANGIPESFGNLWSWNECDIAAFTDAIEDSHTGKEIEQNLGRLKLLRKFYLDRETESMIRLKSTDTCGNTSYLIIT